MLYLLVHALNSYFSSRLITLVGFSSVTRWKIRSKRYLIWVFHFTVNRTHANKETCTGLWFVQVCLENLQRVKCRTLADFSVSSN